MRLVWFLKPGLLIYELFRVIVLIIILVLDAANSSYIILMIFAAQGALFPLMALFLWINAVRYREYLPLFITGKVIGIFTLFCWSLITQETTITAHFFNEMLLVSCDLFALAAIVIIIKDVKNMTEIQPAITEPAPVMQSASENNISANDISTMEEN